MKKFYFLLSMCLLPFLGLAQWEQLGGDIVGNGSGEQDGTSYSKGYSISLSSDGRTLAVGTALGSSSGFTVEDRSYVQVFRWNDGNWQQLGDDILGGENFMGSPNGNLAPPRNGSDIALSSNGNIVAMAESGYYYINPENESEFIINDRTRIFEFVDGEWQQIGEDIFGPAQAIAISSDGSTVVIGKSSDGTIASQSGIVRVYKNENNEWVQVGSTLYGSIAYETFGTSIDLSADGSILAVGAPGGEGGGIEPKPGYAKIYHLQEGEWELEKTIVGLYSNDGWGNGGYSGSSVSLSNDGNIIAVGSSQYRNENNVQVGNVRVFQNINGNWTQIGNMLEGAKSGHENTKHMIDLSSDGTMLSIGTRTSFSSGNVKVYKLNNDEWELVNNVLTSESGENEFGAVARLSSDGSILGVGIFGAMVNGISGAGKTKVFQDCSLSKISVIAEQTITNCSGGTATLSASITPEYYSDNGLINWYDSVDGTEPVFTGTEFETPELSGTTSYWVEAVTVTGCVSERVEVIVNVNPTPELSVGNTNIDTCEGTSVVLNAVSNGTINWYDSAEATEPVFTGASYETPELFETTSYWVEAQSGEGCVSERIEIVVNVLPLPVLEVENTNIEVCLGSDAYLYAFSEGNVIFWYAEEDDTEYLYHGNNFIVEGLTETTTFWVEAYNLNTGCVSERIPVTVTVTPVADISAEETEFEICAGNTATLTATSDSTVNWYDTADGTEPIFSGEEFTTPILNSTTHYWAEASGAGECVSGRIEFTVNVNPSPDAPEAQPIQAYVEGMILADFEVEHTGTLHWYADEELTIELPDTTPVVIHTIYYVTQSLGDCESEATEIMADNFLNTGNPVKDEFAYYPNPVQDRLNFKGSSKVEYVQIFDMSGRLMMDQTNMNSGIEQLDVSSLPKGSYVVKAQTEKGMKTFKIIKN